jgi:PAS domain S-box-containing protein
MNDLSSYVFSPLREGDIALYRGSGDGLAPILLVAAEGTSPERLEHEHALKSELDADWAVRPVALTHYNGRRTLVLEDPGGSPLDRLLLGRPLEVSHFLRIAIRLAWALRRVHERGLVHKDIKPANILVDDASSGAWLTGFGIASRLPRERQTPAPPEVIAGTLAYMAPEQTGRMNRSVDSRSDLYALGVTFYEMLTGLLPFSAADPMEWIHCHIARQAVPPTEQVTGIPEPLSAIVMKLLAKTTEERYQTAGGVEADLRHCLAEWTATGRIDPFPFGARDVSDRLLIPEKLYGRDREIDTLLTSFERVVATGTAELVLVSGYSGIGKSSVVNELHKALVPPRGLFASGKFDQYKRDIPYSTLAQAFQSLVRPLLGKSDAELNGWRDVLLEALGGNGRLMVDVVPELKLIIGDQPAVPEVEPQQAQARFQLVLERFISVFANEEHPLALFLDDLQWLDAATLDLLEDLLTRSNLRHLMLIGAYRDNEVTAAHPLMRKLDAIKTVGGKVAEITLAPLAREHLGQLIADALRCEPERALSLAQLVHEKSGGNPFFTIQFLSSLAEEGMLIFDHDAVRWSWGLGRIHAKGYTDNVVDLMVGKLIRLPARTQTALQQLACVGNTGEIATLSIAFGTSDEQVHLDLWEAVRLDLVERLKDSYRFVHDRVHEAAYSLIPERSRAEAHLRIGRLLAAQTPPEHRQEMIFEIVNQLNRGAALITTLPEQVQLAEFNLIAARRAKASTAYASALRYLVAGATLMPEDSWERRHGLTFELELLRAECEFVTGAMAAADTRLKGLSSRAANTVERASVACLHIDLCTTLAQSSRAIAVALDYLWHLGIEWSPHPTDEDVQREYDRIWSQLGSGSIEDLLELPAMTDPASLATIEVLTKVAPAALTLMEANLHALAICWAANLVLERGNSDGSCDVYVRLGFIAGDRFGDYKAGSRFGKIGCELVERRGSERFQARTFLLFAHFLIPYTQHVRTARDLLHRGFEVANKIGDLVFMGWYSGLYLIENLLASGDPLGEVQHEIERGLAFAQKAQLAHVVSIIQTHLDLVRTLRGLTRKFGSLDEEEFGDARFAEDPNTALADWLYCMRKLQAHFHAGDYTSAIKAATRAQRHTASGYLYQVADLRFYSALSHAALCDTVDQREAHFTALSAHHRQLAIWAEQCPENFETRTALVGAELARLEGRDVDAMRLYEQGIRSARVNSFVQNEALAYELAARFYAARGFDEIAHLYLRNARHCYLRWGADGKVRQLDEIYPQLRKDGPVPAPTSTIGASAGQLDVGTVLKAAQAVSGEIVLGKLIETLLRIAVEHAGAERGLLILYSGDEPRIEAEATTGRGKVEVTLRQTAVSPAELPESVLHTVIRTRESVILDDASAQNPFSADVYLRQKHARSALCLPLVKQAKLLGVLYLENNLVSHVFTPARISVLGVLASQAAISLENARLYSDLQERETRIRRLVDSNIIGVVIWDVQGRIIDANQAFLDIVGYGREDLVSGGLRWTELTPAELRDADEQIISELKAIGTLQPREKEYLRKDGSRVAVLVARALFERERDEGVSFVIDMTDRKQAEEKLRESEERFRDYAETASDWLWETGPDHRFTRISDSVDAIGIAPSLAIGAARWEIARDVASEPEKWRPHREMLDTHQPFRDFVYSAFNESGSPIYVRVGGKPVFGAKGNFLGYRGTGTDITANIRADHAEEELRKAQAELAHVTRVMTLGELAASIAHEVNQPLAGVVANAEACLGWLRRGTPDVDAACRSVEWIIEDGNRASEVVRRVQTLAKKTSLEKVPLDINDVVRETLPLMRRELISHQVTLRMDIAAVLPAIFGDRVQLQQVIINLVMNGIEAMQSVADRPRELLIRSDQDDTGQARVSVADCGVGIVAENVDRLFDPFFTTKSGGMGMGLSICRSIIEAHGGQLWATATVPHGSMFQFTLPVTANMAS